MADQQNYNYNQAPPPMQQYPPGQDPNYNYNMPPQQYQQGQPMYAPVPGQPPMYVPGQGPPGGFNDAASLQVKMETFNNGVIIKQKINLLEVLSGCDMANVYEVWRKDQNGKKAKHRQFKYKEKSSCFDRCLQGSCRPFKMKVTNNQKDSDDDNICMMLNKDCKCAYYCFNRGEMDCYLSDGGNQGEYIGKCFDPWECCHFVFNIFGPAKDVRYTFVADCRQWYFWCQCPCDKCQKVEFEIKEGPITGPTVGALHKVGRGCGKNFLAQDQASTFLVDFPEKADWKCRAMMMNSAVFIDYLMFEEKQENQNV